MKIRSTIFACVITLFSVASHAQGMEELCSRVAEQDVKIKHLIKNESSFLEFALDNIEKSNNNAKTKAILREKLFFIKNRIHLSDEDFKRLSFLRCISGIW